MAFTDTDLSLSRHRFVAAILFILFSLIIFQLIVLAYFRKDELTDIAKRQHNLVIEIEPKRGLIYDKNLKELASSIQVPSFYAAPRLMLPEEKEKLIPILSQMLSVEASFIRKRLAKDKMFVWLKRRGSKEESDVFKALKNPNLGIVDEYQRVYPNESLLGNVIGFCGIDNNGLEGLELHFDSYLKGKKGAKYTKRDAMGREIVSMEQKLIPAVNGYNLVLTIDQYIQYLAQRELEAACEKWNAKGGMAIAMNPKDGSILAMASWPNYDPNNFKDSLLDSRRNRIVTDTFEPGSVFKIVTVSSALNEGAVNILDEFDCEQGSYRVGGHVLHDVHGYGVLDLSTVLTKSSNIGTHKIAKELGPDSLYRYIRKYGFGEKSGVDFPGEVNGIIRPPSKWSKTSMTAIPMGHEVTSTALQCLSALNVIANGGTLVSPRLLSKIVDEKGVEIFKNKPEWKGEVIRPEVAAQMRNILKRVVEEGTGKRAQIEGISVGGKTGTAQKVLENGKGYSHSDFISSFIGFAPVEDPMISMMVVLDDPGPKYYGGTVSAPVFKNVVEQALLYMGYRPETTDMTLETEAA